MTALVFVGPTITQKRAQEIYEVECRPPVRQGDIYRAVTRDRPVLIGIIDGRFQNVPSVWHKEILWAMAQGVHVFGAASMGALRAAELHEFGMQGIGRIFEAYRDGVFEPNDEVAFEDDDEVAVIHGPAEISFIPLSEPMVNIRCTLAKAEAVGKISRATREALTKIAKKTFYQQRSYQNLLRHPDVLKLSAAEIAQFRYWLPDGKVNQKLRDAEAMLEAVRTFMAEKPGPMRAHYDFAHTTLWESSIAVAASGAPARTDTESADQILDELRLAPTAYLDARRAAYRRLVALEECDRRGIEVEAGEIDQAIASLRFREGLASRGQLQKWLADNDLAQDSFRQLMREEARLQKLETDAGPPPTRCILDHLRTEGGYASLAHTAREKARTLAESDGGELSSDALVELELLIWYFERHMGCEIPTDVHAYADAFGFESKDAFVRAIWREYRSVSTVAKNQG